MINFKLLIDKALKLGFSDIEIVEKSSKSLEIIDLLLNKMF